MLFTEDNRGTLETVWRIAEIIKEADRGAWDEAGGIRETIAARLHEAFPSVEADAIAEQIRFAELHCRTAACRACPLRHNTDCELLHIAANMIDAFPQIVPEVIG